MLPPYIIEQLRQREDARKQERAQPQPQVELELEVDLPHAPRRRPADDAPSERGVIILQIC